MDRDITTGNKIIANLMQQKEKKRMQSRIKYIKSTKSEYSNSKAMFKRQVRLNSAAGPEVTKNLEIQRENIALFNRIASIIKPKTISKCQRPGGTLSALNISKNIKQSRDKISGHKKIKSTLQQENKLIQQRLNKQKPTINNKLFYQQRAKNQKYLKRMGKYPYILNRRAKTEKDFSVCDQTQSQFPFISRPSKQRVSSQSKRFQQLYHHETLDFIISIQYERVQQIQQFRFQIKDLHAKDTYKLIMGKAQFIECFEECSFEYEKMVNRLRLNDEGKVVFERQKVNDENQYQKRNKEKKDKHRISLQKINHCLPNKQLNSIKNIKCKPQHYSSRDKSDNKQKYQGEVKQFKTQSKIVKKNQDN